MNKKFIYSIFFIVKMCYTQINEEFHSEQVQSGSDIDFDKVNGRQCVDKLSLTNIETSMKLMEDNILRLMRELGELKMQVYELKNNIKKEIESQTKTIEHRKDTSNTKSIQEVSITVTKSN